MSSLVTVRVDGARYDQHRGAAGGVGRGLHLPTHGVLLVDEAGMIGTRQLHQLLTLARDRDCKVVLVGDPAQLPELEAGGVFARLTQQSTALRLDGHARQQHAWEREALDALRHGRTPDALDAYRAHGRLRTSPDRDAAQQQAAEAYLTARAGQPDPWQVLLLASSRDQVRALNDQVRARLLEHGALGETAVTVETADGPISYRVGDQVLVTRNDHQRGLLNGTTATVTYLDRDRLTLTTSQGQHVTVDRTWLAAGQLDHGYAMTIHKAQGRTVHTALLVGDDSLSTQAGYVGLSRGTDGTHVFLTSQELTALTADCGGRVRYLEPAERPELARPLSRDTRQHLALDHYDDFDPGRILGS